MSNKIEGYVPVVQSDGLNTAKDATFSGSNTFSGAVAFNSTATFAAGGGLTPSGTAVILIGNSSTGTEAGGSVTINAQRGLITTSSLTTGSLTVASFDLVNNKIGTTSQVFASVYNGTNSQGVPLVTGVKVATTGSATINLYNASTTQALNGTLKVNFIVLS